MPYNFQKKLNEFDGMSINMARIGKGKEILRSAFPYFNSYIEPPHCDSSHSKRSFNEPLPLSRTACLAEVISLSFNFFITKQSAFLAISFRFS